MKYGIIGGGIAVLAAIREIRRNDRQGEIGLITDEKPPFYHRPLIPLLLSGARSEQDLVAGDDILDKAGVHLIHDRATGLDSGKMSVLLESGRNLAFRKILIATGARPLLPDISGMRGNNIHAMRSIADARGLREIARNAKKGIIIGGGLVGIKTGLALRDLGLSVTVVEQAPQILYPRFDNRSAELVREALEKKGLVIIAGSDIQEIIPEGRGVRLASGRTLSADFIVMATGMRPNTEWLNGGGLDMGRAIRVNGAMETSIPSIYAAGDVVELTDPVTGRIFVSGLWGNAMEMGRTAGANMSGGKRRAAPCLEIANATEIAGIPMISIGDIHSQEEGVKTVRQEERGSYKMAVFRGDRLIGAVFAGKGTEKAGVYANLIRNRISIAGLLDKAERFTLTAADLLRHS